MLETHRPFMASIADISAVETPEEIFMEQAGFAPSQSIPDKLATIFLTAAQASSYPPPISQVIAVEAPVEATTQPQRAESRPKLC